MQGGKGCHEDLLCVTAATQSMLQDYYASPLIITEHQISCWCVWSSVVMPARASIAAAAAKQDEG